MSRYWDLSLFEGAENRLSFGGKVAERGVVRAENASYDMLAVGEAAQALIDQVAGLDFAGIFNPTAQAADAMELAETWMTRATSESDLVPRTTEAREKIGRILAVREIEQDVVELQGLLTSAVEISKGLGSRLTEVATELHAAGPQMLSGAKAADKAAKYTNQQLGHQL